MDHYGDAPRQPVFELRSDAESGVQVASVTKGRVRADDMRRLHQQAADRVRAALIEADYWTKELLRLGNHVERAENDLQDTIDRRQRLRVPNPLFPVEKM